MDPNQITVEPFQPQDQDEAKALVLAGLGEHWGYINYSANPDLDDIAATYAGNIFVVARLGAKIVGTGALVRQGDDAGRIVRVSVARDVRRRGIGNLILDHLKDEAIRAGLSRLVLETTAAWAGVTRFYIAYGFRRTHADTDQVQFILDLK